MRGLLVLLGVCCAVWLVIMFTAWYSHPHPRPVPRPPPFSCSQTLRDLAPIDGGGQIAPVCGATPYPSAPPDGS